MEKDIIILKSRDFSSSYILGVDYTLLLNFNDIEIIKCLEDHNPNTQAFVSGYKKFFSSEEGRSLLNKYNKKYIYVKFIGPSRITGENMFHFSAKRNSRNEKIDEILNA